MAGIIPVAPADPHEPTVAEWDTFMTAVAAAGSDVNAVISLVIYVNDIDANGNPSSHPIAPDFRIPVKWLTVSPRFDITPPVVTPPTPPAPTYEVLYVTSTTGLKVRKTPSTTGEQIGSLAYRAQAMVAGETPADGFTWGALQSGGYVAREFLSKIQPNP